MCSLGSNTESPEECDKESDFKIWIFKFLGKVLHKPETRRPGKRERTNEDTVMHPEEGVKSRSRRSSAASFPYTNDATIYPWCCRS